MDNMVSVITISDKDAWEDAVQQQNEDRSLLKTDRVGFWIDLKSICGFLSYSKDKNHSFTELTRIFINPDHVRKGLGTLLLKLTVQYLIQDEGINSIYVTVPPTIHVIIFFLKFGFSFAPQYPYNIGYTLTNDLNLQMVHFINCGKFDEMQSNPRYEVFKSSIDGSYRLCYTGPLLDHFTSKNDKEEVKTQVNESTSTSTSTSTHL